MSARASRPTFSGLATGLDTGALIEGLLPVSVGLILLVFVGGVFDVPVLALLVFVLLPAGLDLALLMAVDDLGGASRRIEAGRLAAALALAGGVVALRGGL